MSDDILSSFADSIQSAIRALFEATPFARLLEDPSALLVRPGKMLRSRLLMRVGHANGIERERIVRGGAAMELIHTATLLHDDLIDQSLLRRHEPAYWAKHGAPGAILLGDLLMLYAFQALRPLNDARLTEAFIRFAGEVGEAEVMQELLRRGTPQTWQECLDTARHKTGPFFAFMAFMAAGNDEALCADLVEAGYLAGTAYQLADDLHDAHGSSDQSGKSVRLDGHREKNTTAAFSGSAIVDPVSAIQELCGESVRRLGSYPAVQSAWQEYLDKDLSPAIRQLMQHEQAR